MGNIYVRVHIPNPIHRLFCEHKERIPRPALRVGDLSKGMKTDWYCNKCDKFMGHYGERRGQD